MSDFTDLSHLPKAERQTEGEPPDKESRFGRLLVEKWHREADDNKPNAVPGARFRHSMAGACSRAIAYSALGVPVSNPPDGPAHYLMRLGDEIHKAWQAALQEEYPHAEIEVKVGEGDAGGHLDAEIKLDDLLIVDELKSVGGYAYKLALGWGNAAPGPKYEHKLQCFLNARRRNADQAVITYLSRDAYNDAEKKGLEPVARVTAEWTYPREVFEPLADKEMWRIEQILAMLDDPDDPHLPARKIPDPEFPLKHVIRNPKAKGGKGEWVEWEGDRLVNAGQAWQCAYCRYQDTCARTGSHRESVDVLVEIGALPKEALRNGGSREQ